MHAPTTYIKDGTEGASVLRCFGGHGAVRLLRVENGAQVLEYIDGPQLRTLVDEGQGDKATEIIADVVVKLHSYSGPIPSDLWSMERNFRSLFKKVESDVADSIYLEGANVAKHLLATAQDIRVLHGDIHHENILHSSTRGWLAIDPKCVYGESTYDLANTFFNPIGFVELADSQEVIVRRSQIFAERLGIDRQRILQYAFAYGCLSAAWCIEDGLDPNDRLHIARSIRLCYS